MPTVRIPAGIVRGESRAYTPGRYYAGSLIRWHEGNMRPVGGWERITPTPFLSVGRAGLTWTDNSYRKHIGVLCDGHCYRYNANDGWVNITPAGYHNAEDLTSARGFGSGVFGKGNFGDDSVARGDSAGIWNVYAVAHSIDYFGQELIFGSSVDGNIYVWDPDTPQAAPIVAPNVPKLMRCFLSTDEHHLMVFGGQGTPNRVAWSDQGNREGWDYTLVTGQAGFYDLEAAGQILTAKKIPGGILVFTDASVWLGTYIGTPYYYGFTKIAEAVAPVSPQAVVVAGGKAYWMGRRTFHKFEGGVVSNFSCTLDLDPSASMDAMNAARRVCGGANGVYPEIWWFYPSAGQNGSPKNDRYCVFNYVDGWWSEGYLDRSFYVSDLIGGYPLAGSSAGHVYQMETGMLDEGRPREGMIWAEVGALGFDDGENNWTVTQAQVDGRPGNGAAAGAVRFDFSGVHARGAQYKALGSWSPRASGYMDCRFTAKDFTFRVVGLADVDWSVGALNFKAVKRGYR